MHAGTPTQNFKEKFPEIIVRTWQLLRPPASHLGPGFCLRLFYNPTNKNEGDETFNKKYYFISQ